MAEVVILKRAVIVGSMRPVKGELIKRSMKVEEPEVLVSFLT